MAWRPIAILFERRNNGVLLVIIDLLIGIILIIIIISSSVAKEITVHNQESKWETSHQPSLRFASRETTWDGRIFSTAYIAHTGTL